MKKWIIVGFGLLLAFPLSCERIKKEVETKKKEKEKPIWVESKERKPTTVPWKGQAVAADTFIQIAKLADPGVVNVGTTKKIQGNFQNPFQDFFREFFGEEPPQARPEQRQRMGLGSGFVISEDGYIVTNNHVIDKADEISVTIQNGQEYLADVMGTDPQTDLALIKIKPKQPLVPLALGDSDRLSVGEIVVAIGNPFGLSHTVTQGIVSAKERSIGFGRYDAFIQTDASINPGNSGGPLLNLKAEVVGINSAMVATGQGIGFAIPINLAKSIITQLRETGTVKRGWLGVVIQAVDEDMAKSLGLKKRRGALVSNVQKDSPAAKAGIQVGDVIVKVGEKRVDEFQELPRYVAAIPVGKSVAIGVLRNGKELTLNVAVGEFPEEQLTAIPGGPKGPKSKSAEPDKLGLQVATLTPQMAERFGLDSKAQGVWVEQINPQSPAFEKGIRRGDLILEVNRKAVKDVQSYINLLKTLKKGDSVLLLIKRGGATTLFIAFTL